MSTELDEARIKAIAKRAGVRAYVRRRTSIATYVIAQMRIQGDVEERHLGPLATIAQMGEEALAMLIAEKFADVLESEAAQ